MLLSLPLFAGLACGTGGGDGGAIPVADFEARARDAICGRETRCGVFPDQSACEGAVFTMLQLSADISSGKVKYDGQAAAECLSAYESSGCNISDERNVINQSKSCLSVIQGTVADGGGCLIGAECISEVCNTSACGGDTCCLGACQSPVSAGADCSASGSVCAADTFCKATSSSTASCVPWIAAGAPCTESDVCVPGKICNIAAAATTGICGNAPAEGEACPAGICDAIVDSCEQGICVRKIAVGGACSSTTPCVAYANCDPTTMVCVAKSAAGGACVSASDCVGGIACENNTCVSPADIPACT